MYKAKVNKQFEIEIDQDKPIDWDIQTIKKDTFHIIKNHQSYKAEIIDADLESKKVHLKINGKIFEVEVKDKMDLLLEKLGMSSQLTRKVNDIKAPMPGLVLDIKVKPGDTIQKGEGVIVLEAMKMENLLKSPGDGVVKSIDVKEGEAVEKNQVLINLE